MPDDSSRTVNLNEGWAGATSQQAGKVEKGWQPAPEKHGYQPAASTQPPSPPQGGSGMPAQSSGSQSSGSGSSGEKH